MSSEKRGFNPWIITVILGVVAILFSVYALQEQAAALRSREEAEKLKTQLEECEKRSVEMTEQFKKSQEDSYQALKQAEAMYQEVISKKKK